jgi:hypothetical protein
MDSNQPPENPEATTPLRRITYLGSLRFPAELHEKVLEYTFDELPIQVFLAGPNRFAAVNFRAELLPPLLFVNKFFGHVGVLAFLRSTKFILDGQEKTWRLVNEIDTVPKMRAKFLKLLTDLDKIFDGHGNFQCAIRKLAIEDVTALRQEYIPIAPFCHNFPNLKELELDIFYTEVLDQRGRRPLPVGDVLLNLKLNDIFSLGSIRRLVIRLKIPTLVASPDMVENRVHKVNKFVEVLKPTLIQRFERGVDVEVVVDVQQGW